MSPLALSVKSLRHRKVTVALTVMSLALGVALLLGVERMRGEVRSSFTNTISGTDLIVGARTGEVSLLLSSVFRIGNSSQNISWESYQKILANPKVAWTIPISLGDSHRGYRVLGTTTDYFRHYRYANKRPLELAKGAEFSDTYDAVLGAEVAKSLRYTVGTEIVLSHGVGEVSFVDHAEKPFRVSGILKPTGTPVDQCVHVSLEAIEAVHEGWECEAGHHEHEHDDDHEPHPGQDHGEPTAGGSDSLLEGGTAQPLGKVAAGASGFDRLAEIEAMLAGEDEEHLHAPRITAFLLGMHSRPDAVFLQRAINTYTGEPLTAVMPGVALQELWQVVGVVENTILVISIFVLAVSLAGMLSVLMTSLNERRREVAILRAVGARPVHIVALIVGEALAVTAFAIALGVALLYVLVAVARPIVLAKAGLDLGFSMLSGRELLLIAAVMVVGLLVGLLPAWRCYRNSLADGLTVKV